MAKVLTDIKQKMDHQIEVDRKKEQEQLKAKTKNDLIRTILILNFYEVR